MFWTTTSRTDRTLKVRNWSSHGRSALTTFGHGDFTRWSLDVEKGYRAAKFRLLEEGEREKRKKEKKQRELSNRKERKKRGREEKRGTRRVTRSSSNVRKVRPLPNPAATTLFFFLSNLRSSKS